MSQTIKGHIEVPVDYLNNKLMKQKLNWGNLFETIAYIGIACMAVGIMFFAFTFLWQIFKSIF
jgi:CO dehydrogenase/acetyl-CoA synthase alpha subunit